MKIKYKEREYIFPDSLADITIAQRIQFYELYGKGLDDKVMKIDKIANEFNRQSELSAWHLNSAICQFAFYTGLPLPEVQKDADILSLLDIYHTAMLPLMKEEQKVELIREIEIDGQAWVIDIPELLATSSMTFNEFLHAKEIVRQLEQLGNGKWHSLPYLCAIYLRKPGEAFDELFVTEGSERLLFMQKLPLNIAIGVGFFLTNTVNIYSTTSQYSSPQKQKESIPQNILTGGDG
jgi:hypothetical protein